MLLPRRSRLAYPAGAIAGFNPVHVGCTGIIGSSGGFVSMVSRGANLFNLVRGIPGTLVGAPTSTINGVIGPATGGFVTAGGVYVESTLNPAPSTPTAITGAGIIVPTAQGGDAILCSNNLTGFSGDGFELRTGVLAWFNSGSGGVATSGFPAMGIGNPFFWVASYSAGLQNWVACNLATGKIYAAQTTTATIVGSSGTGTWTFGGTSGNGSTCNIAAAYMAENVFLGLPHMLAWAQDPWSFWYPTKDKANLTGRSAAVAMIYQKRRFVLWR